MKNNKAFTLIELLVAVLIIGILAAIAISQYQRVVAKSQLMQGITLGKSLQEAEERYYLEHGTYTKNLSDLDIDITPQKVEQHTSYKDIMVYYLANGYKMSIAINGAGEVEDRIEIRIPGNSNTGIAYYFIHSKRYLGGAGKRACFSDNIIYQNVCLSLKGTFFYGSSQKVYLIP